MAKVSVIIPSRNERYLRRTVEDLLANATGAIEVLPVVDGLTNWAIPDQDPRVNTIDNKMAIGMRKSINKAAGLAQGEYLMKADAHCSFGRGYDEILQADCDRDWIAIPRRYALDPDKWQIDIRQPATDAHYLQYPWLREPPCWHGCKWPERTDARRDWPVDDEMDSQGSCWFMHRDHFQTMDFEHYGDFFQESQELCLRTWMSGGRVVVNKRTWYAHWHKPRDLGRGYYIGRREKARAEAFSFDYWWNNRMPGAVRSFEWLIDHFNPVPTWPQDWKTLHGLRGSDGIRQEGRAGDPRSLGESQ